MIIFRRETFSYKNLSGISGKPIPEGSINAVEYHIPPFWMFAGLIVLILFAY